VQGSGAVTLEELMRLRATSTAAASTQLAGAHARLLAVLQQLAATLQQQQLEAAAREVEAAAALAGAHLTSSLTTSIARVALLRVCQSLGVGSHLQAYH
jgi:hypothetical protein